MYIIYYQKLNTTLHLPSLMYQVSGIVTKMVVLFRNVLMYILVSKDIQGKSFNKIIFINVGSSPADS